MNPLNLTAEHVGRTLRIETKVKSRPILGKITKVINRNSYVRVELEGAFGTRGEMLTADSMVSLAD